MSRLHRPPLHRAHSTKLEIQPIELAEIDQIRTFVSPNRLLLYLPVGGEGGIRTHGRLPFTRFP
ncbi:MAG: hypothetical protein WCL17_05285, partial [Actinomycetota bacterium]